MRERTRWLCSYAIGRLATSVAAEREQTPHAGTASQTMTPPDANGRRA
jgi:hypothetical protein